MRFNRRFKQGRSICLSDASSLWQMVSDLKSLNFKPKLLGKLNRCLRPFARFEQITHGANAPPNWTALRPAINRYALGRIFFIKEPPRLKVSLWGLIKQLR
jgi:hypothetical protein